MNRTPGDGTITGWSWDFGDGQTSTAQNPVSRVCRCRYLHGHTDGDRFEQLAAYGNQDQLHHGKRRVDTADGRLFG